MISLPDNLKECVSCRTLKARSEFYRQDSAPDGLRKKCKSCYNQMSNDRKQSLRPKRTPGPVPGIARQRIPYALPDATVDWMPAPEDFLIARVEKAAELERAVAALMDPDIVCRVVLFSGISAVFDELPVEFANGDIDWVICNRPKPGCPEVPRALARQCESFGIPFFCFDEIGLLPIDGQHWAQVPEILSAVN